ncbi:MAG: hypothetical protein KAR17_19090 [Cyclobacteriaceae bacterium]|nr:hypothetical protein [Cyclobacteriaceae bacterium]
MEKTDNNLRIRPRFRKEVSDAPEIVKDKIKTALESNSANCTGKIVDNHVIFKIPVSQQHYWSPQLTLDLEPKNSGSLIRGLYGPKPGVWTMFVFFYSAIGFLTMMGLIFGLSQMTLKMDPYGLWSVPIGGILLIGLFVISKIGQRLGQEQMQQLKDFLDDSLNPNQDNLDL